MAENETETMAETKIETHRGSSGKPGKMVKTRALEFEKPRSLSEIQARQDAMNTRRRPTRSFSDVKAKENQKSISVPDVEPTGCEEPDEGQNK